MEFYTSVLPYRGRLLVRGVDKDGTHKKYRINYKPSLFVPVGKETKYKTLDGRYVERIKFDSMPEATKWVNEYKNVTNFEYFGNTRHQYPFIADEFPGPIDWDLKQVKLLSIDIECESENGFPSPDKAAEPLICITVKDHTSKKIIVFGMGNFVNDREDVQYFNCSTETHLIEMFTKFWVGYNPDIITGWNVKFFDIPYLMNRFRYLMGDKWVNQFSPWGVVEQRSTRGYNKQENFLTLGKGSFEGLKTDMAVISDKGVVGIIEKTSKNYEVLVGPYKSINLLKNDYIELKFFGFEELDIFINE